MQRLEGCNELIMYKELKKKTIWLEPGEEWDAKKSDK